MLALVLYSNNVQLELNHNWLRFLSRGLRLDKSYSKRNIFI